MEFLHRFPRTNTTHFKSYLYVKLFEWYMPMMCEEEMLNFEEFRFKEIERMEREPTEFINHRNLNVRNT